MTDLSEFVTLNSTTLSTDSRRVAKHFGKAHKSVLRAFDNLKCDDEYRRRNYVLTMADVPGPKGSVRQERLVQMTKDGFVLLVMGFTGEKAVSMKIAYINAFNQMADQLQEIAINGYRSLWDQRLELEKKDATTFMWASFGSKCMSQRKKELPSIREERRELEEKMQPQLALVQPEAIA